MSGQPNIEGFAEFDVTDIAVTWEQGTTAGNNLAILNVDEDFTITVTFAGNGTQWDFLQSLSLPYRIEIFAEGIGLPPVDHNFVPVDGALVPDNELPYAIDCTVPGLSHAGVYRLAVMVTFPGCPGWLGFLEGPFIQVHSND